MLKTFIKYALVGGLNTVIHWLTFAVVYYALHFDQMISNFSGFCVAVTFSFFVNAIWTFRSEHTATRYFMYVGFMGLIAIGCGYIADIIQLNPLITLAGFSAMSLLIGFFYSTFIVFREDK